MATGSGTREDPWVLTTPPGTSEYQMYRDEGANPPALVCTVGKTELRYHLRAVEDLHAWLRHQGDWVPLGGTDEQKEAPAGSVEAWGRSADNPVGGWYGLKKGLRGRFGIYVPGVLEVLGLAEVEHNPRNNRIARHRIAAVSGRAGGLVERPHARHETPLRRRPLARADTPGRVLQ